MTALAHVSAVLPSLGVIAPIVIWATQKDKSEYVAFQALQAVAYQLLIILAWFVGMGCYMLSFFSTFLVFPITAGGDEAKPVVTALFMATFFIPVIIIGLIFIGDAIFIRYGVVGAASTFQGRDFRYIILGKRLETYLQKNP